MGYLGTFYKGDLDKAYENLSKYLMLSFEYIKDNLKQEWESPESIIVINKGVFAIIKLLSDIVDFLLENDIINEKSNPTNTFNETKHYLDPIINFFKNITSDTVIELKTSYGIGGDTKYWRTLQKEVRDTYNEFNPNGLDEFLLKEKKEYNTEAFEIIREIETFFNKDFKIRLEDKYEDEWFDKGVPPKIQDNSVVLAQQKKRETGNKVEPWDCLHVIDYREIALKNWRDIFEKCYTRPHETKISGGKEAKTKWIVELNRLRNQNFHSYYVTKDEIEFLRDLSSWLLSK